MRDSTNILHPSLIYLNALHAQVDLNNGRWKTWDPPNVNCNRAYKVLDPQRVPALGVTAEVKSEVKPDWEIALHLTRERERERERQKEQQLCIALSKNDDALRVI